MYPGRRKHSPKWERASSSAGHWPWATQLQRVGQTSPLRGRRCRSLSLRTDLNPPAHWMGRSDQSNLVQAEQGPGGCQASQAPQTADTSPEGSSGPGGIPLVGSGHCLLIPHPLVALSVASARPQELGEGQAGHSTLKRGSLGTPHTSGKSQSPIWLPGGSPTGPRVSSLMAVPAFPKQALLSCNAAALSSHKPRPSKESDATRAWQTCSGVDSTGVALHLDRQTHLLLLAQSHGWPSFLAAAKPCHILFKATTHRLFRTLEAVLPEGASPTQQPPQHPENGCRAVATALSQLHRWAGAPVGGLLRGEFVSHLLVMGGVTVRPWHLPVRCSRAV